MKSLTFLIVGLLSCLDVIAQIEPRVSPKDLTKLIGDWKGTLTYLGYSTNKPFSMEANLKVLKGDRSNTFLFYNIYPYEPQANSIDTLLLSKEGKRFADEDVTSKKKLRDGRLEVMTQIEGRDGNENNKATIRHIYLISSADFSKSKWVRFDGAQNWIKRNEYLFQKVK
ncbi:hypothetical protein EXU57_11050 [Segetibacter sp. 3557_3]|uniref:hypothetical protein n=1 Tax=Segetibacter sp. 3557_3 TaxID=2547429 RepID=UPI0010590403|nr:hypothetical protein [Segetibacter sp. 3557_3]TDH26618.1 hypothetical protein EXU57_11050 [Segetibacter sp. 3557_3]